MISESEKLFLEAVNDFKQLIDDQLQNIIAGIEKYQLDSLVHVYLVEQNKAILNDINFFILVINSPNFGYSLFIVRMMLDRVTKLSFLSTKNFQTQLDICRKDLLQFYKVYYQNAENDNAKESYLKKFNKSSEGTNDNIDTKGRIDRFPNFFKRIKAGNGILDNSELYFAFQITSEYIHGNLGQLLYRPNEKKFSLLLMVTMLYNMAKINDWHLNNKHVSSKTLELINKYKHLD